MSTAPAADASPRGAPGLRAPGDLPSGLYSLDFSQIANGAASSSSSLYSMEDSVRIAAADGQTQQAATYRVTNPMEPSVRANNGLAIGQGTGLHLSWTGTLPPAALGFRIYHSRTPQASTFTLITPVPLTGNEFQHEPLPGGMHYYIVHVTYLNDTSEEWTGVFFGYVDAPVVTPTPTITPTPAPTPVSATDVAQYLVGTRAMTPADKAAADANRDGKIDVSDVIRLIVE